MRLVKELYYFGLALSLYFSTAFIAALFATCLLSEGLQPWHWAALAASLILLLFTLHLIKR